MTVSLGSMSKACASSVLGSRLLVWAGPRWLVRQVSGARSGSASGAARGEGESVVLLQHPPLVRVLERLAQARGPLLSVDDQDGRRRQRPPVARPQMLVHGHGNLRAKLRRQAGSAGIAWQCLGRLRRSCRVADHGHQAAARVRLRLLTVTVCDGVSVSW